MSEEELSLIVQQLIQVLQRRLRRAERCLNMVKMWQCERDYNVDNRFTRVGRQAFRP